MTRRFEPDGNVLVELFRCPPPFREMTTEERDERVAYHVAKGHDPVAAGDRVDARWAARVWGCGAVIPIERVR